MTSISLLGFLCLKQQEKTLELLNRVKKNPITTSVLPDWFSNNSGRREKKEGVSFSLSKWFFFLSLNRGSAKSGDENHKNKFVILGRNIGKSKNIRAPKPLNVCM
jgi:hypothetical protein